MRHVTDGDLHAYLDGGLELHPPGEAERIRAHLEACGSCRTRLEEAREISDRAASVLAAVDPGPVEAPPFEELRRRALGTGGRAAGTGRRLSRAGILRIAATAVVALGVGWMAGRGGAGPAADGIADAGPSQIPTSGDARTAERQAWEAEPVDALSDGAARGIGRPAAPLLPMEEPSPEASPRVAAEPAKQVAAAVDEAVEPRIAEGVEKPVEAGAAVIVGRRESAAADSAAALVGAAAEKAAPSRTLPAETVAPAAFSAARDRADRPAPPAAPAPSRRVEELTESRSAGPEATSRRLAVPGLTVVSLEWTEVAPGVSGLRVVQRLGTGDTIELRFGGLEGGEPLPDYLLRESLPEGVRQVAVPFEEGWLVARAPLEEEQIRALVALIP